MLLHVYICDVISHSTGLSGLYCGFAQNLFLSLVQYISLFFKQEMELSLIGLQNAGKTSLVNVIAVRD